jgi:hypothetical protein
MTELEKAQLKIIELQNELKEVYEKLNFIIGILQGDEEKQEKSNE